MLKECLLRHWPFPSYLKSSVKYIIYTTSYLSLLIVASFSFLSACSCWISSFSSSTFVLACTSSKFFSYIQRSVLHIRYEKKTLTYYAFCDKSMYISEEFHQICCGITYIKSSLDQNQFLAENFTFLFFFSDSFNYVVSHQSSGSSQQHKLWERKRFTFEIVGKKVGFSWKWFCSNELLI